MNLVIIKDLLINLLFVILPFHVYYLFVKGRHISERLQNVYWTSSGILLIFLIMSFPITVIDNHVFDLRQIPIIIAFLYLSRKIGVTLLLAMIVIRYFEGGVGFYGSLFVNVVLLLILFVIHKRFHQATTFGKFIITVILSALSSLFIFIFFLIFNNIDLTIIRICINLFIAQTIGFFIAIYSIEKVKRNADMEVNVQKAEKAQIVSDLAASVSHEVRNPLTVTKGFIQLVLNQNLEKDTKEYLQLALKELNTAENIISDYLTFAKPALENPTKLDVGHELQLVINLMKSYANMRNVKIVYHHKKDLFVIGEPKKFGQCITNIIKNGIEAMPTGGTLTVDLKDDERLITIVITDTGVGIKEDELNRIGEPYFSTKKDGTGLGMMVVFSIINSMNGKIFIDSKKGKGTRFTIQLPK